MNSEIARWRIRLQINPATSQSTFPFVSRINSQNPWFKITDEIKHSHPTSAMIAQPLKGSLQNKSNYFYSNKSQEPMTVKKSFLFTSKSITIHVKSSEQQKRFNAQRDEHRKKCISNVKHKCMTCRKVERKQHSGTVEAHKKYYHHFIENHLL